MLKSFDFFRKIQTEQELTSTTGGVFTIIAFAVEYLLMSKTAGLLIFFSIQDYYRDTYFTFLAVKNDDSQYLPMRIDITFNRIPCQVIGIQFNDELQYVQSNIEDKLKMYLIQQNGQELLYQRNTNSRRQEKQSLENSIKQKHQCRINGIINVPKTPGKIIFKATGNQMIINELDFHLINQLRLSYKLKTLQFGLGNNVFDFPIAHKSKVIEDYIKDLEGNFTTRQIVQDFSKKEEKVNFYNHLKIIPVVFDQNSSLAQTGQKYRYSLRAGQAPCYQSYQQIYFSTQIQPINIVYKKQEASFYSLAVSLLAIVGGTVATIGIVNSISHFIFNIK